MCLDADLDAPCYSIASISLLPTALLRSNTKVLAFPGALPEYRTNYNYMDIYQPHGSKPTSKSSCALWGAWNDQKTAWRSVASFSNPQMAEICRRFLQRGTGRTELSSLLSSHWVNLLRCIYRIGINDGRLILRNAAEDIEKIVSTLLPLSTKPFTYYPKKYRNCAQPSTGSANVCLMYLNHLDHFKHMTKSLCENVKNHPPRWQCPDPQKLSPLGWFQEVDQHLDAFDKEVILVVREAEEVRKMVLP